MDALDLQKRYQPLSVDDGEIGRALDALDEQLREWFTALGGSSACGVDAEPLGRPAEPAPPAEEEHCAPDLAEPPAAPELPAAPEPLAAADQHDEHDEHDEHEEDEEHEEALLASLDPKIATAIRVKRRLTHNKRSVRELLAEIEVPRDAKCKKRQRKSWWR